MNEPPPQELPSSTHPYDALTPDVILDAIDHCALQTDGRLLGLNSYENRVYQVGIENNPPVIAKFYRPGRWTDESILEEHAFSLALVEQEIPVIAPLRGPDQKTLQTFKGFRYALFPRKGGRWPELNAQEDLTSMGRFMARIHQVGRVAPFEHRPALSIQEMGYDAVHYIQEHGFIPAELVPAYSSLLKDLLADIEDKFKAFKVPAYSRIHGDCHPGNILWTDTGPHFVDFDDTRMGPAVQDLWMLLSGEYPHMCNQMGYILDGYNEFAEFDLIELNLIEPLRTLRMIHYAAWLARRWSDPTFPLNFPWFNTSRYWEEHILSLREQAAHIHEPPLCV